MELNTLENQILIDIYEADMFPGMSFEIANFNLKEEDKKKQTQEFAFYLVKLKRLGFVQYEENEAFINGGNISTKYNNNVAMIYEEKIHIDSKGVDLVEWYNHQNSEIQRQVS
jgi:hypothetical protein